MAAFLVLVSIEKAAISIENRSIVIPRVLGRVFWLTEISEFRANDVESVACLGFDARCVFFILQHTVGVPSRGAHAGDRSETLKIHDEWNFPSTFD